MLENSLSLNAWAVFLHITSSAHEMLTKKHVHLYKNYDNVSSQVGLLCVMRFFFMVLPCTYSEMIHLIRILILKNYKK